MNSTAIAYALQILTALPQLIAAGVEVSSIIKKSHDSLADMQATGRNPTDAEWGELNATIGRLRGELHG